MILFIGPVQFKKLRFRDFQRLLYPPCPLPMRAKKQNTIVVPTVTVAC